MHSTIQIKNQNKMALAMVSFVYVNMRDSDFVTYRAPAIAIQIESKYMLKQLLLTRPCRILQA